MKEKKIFHVAHVTESPSADAGFSRLYPKADGWYTKDSAGNEVRIEGIVVLDNAGTALDQKRKIQFLSPLTTAVDGDKIKVGVDTEGHSWEDAGTTPAGIKPVLDKDVHVSKITALEMDIGSITDLETHLGTLESLWEENGATGISPKDDKKPIMTSFEAISGTVDFLTVSDELKVTAHSGHTGIKPAGFNADGELVPWDSEEEEEEDGDAHQGRRVQILQGGNTPHTVVLTYPNILVANPDVNTVITLPDPGDANNAEITVKKIISGSYAVTIYSAGSVSGPFVIDNINEQFGGLTTITQGAWIKLKSSGGHWWVLQDDGNWGPTT